MYYRVKYVNKEDVQPTKRVLQMWNKTKLKPGRDLLPDYT